MDRTIIDLAQDCQVEIFMYLSIEDLLNVADTNKQLKPAADIVFSRKFVQKTVQCNHVREMSDPFQTLDIFIDTYDSSKPNTLRLLRSFGHLISKLSTEHIQQLNSRRHGSDEIFVVLSYINEYCSESLTEIEFYRINWVEASTWMKKPFKNIECIKFGRCIFNETNAKIDCWFPSVRHVYFLCTFPTHFVFADGQNLQHVQCLDIIYPLSVPHSVWSQVKDEHDKRQGMPSATMI